VVLRSFEIDSLASSLGCVLVDGFEDDFLFLKEICSV
jgi:hypothetical protein